MGLTRPEIEIIRTGREKRKSENVSECAYALQSVPPPPPPPTPTPTSAPSSANLSIHPCCAVSSLFGFVQTEAAGRVEAGVCVCGLDWVAIRR